MSNRLFAGSHPIFGIGLFMSRAGVDVFSSSNPDDYLINSAVKNEQVLMTGGLVVAPGEAVAVYFPALLTDPPMVFFWPSIVANTIYYPYAPSARPTRGTYRLTAQSLTSAVVFSNDTGVYQAIYYAIMARSLA